MPLLPQLPTWLDEAAARHDIPGAAIAVGLGADLAEAATGVTSRVTGVAATPETLFQIGSVTKVWTATLVMQLVDDGLIGLDRPVRDYLPEFGVVDPVATETVTVRQLLLHQGGFEGDLFEDTGRGDDALNLFLAFMHHNAPQVVPPGTLFSYCNAGYCVLGALVAKLRGGTWEEVLRERVIEPLGAKHMALLAEEAILFRAAVGHMESGPFTRWQLPRSNGPAGATPCAAPRDLVRFGRMFLAGGLTESGARVLSPDALAVMLSPQIELPGLPERGEVRRGLGPSLFDWEGNAAFGHDGSTLGQGTQWRVVPEHGLVVAMSANHDACRAFFDELLDRVVKELTGIVVPARPTGSARPGPPELEGRYSFPLCTYSVVATGDGLEVTATPHPIDGVDGGPATTERYTAVSDSTFVTEKGWTISFVDDGRYLYNGRLVPRV
jgi:CubicO group peptidase (beta-lactamase class C family)